MKRIFSILICLVSVISYSQEKGSITGAVTDKETGNQPLPFANVTIKNTSKGTTTDFDGLYEITNIDPGTYTVVFSFVGYETLEVPDVKVVANKVTEVNTGLGASAAALDEVMITTVARRDSETALLLDQKDAIDIKESIGAQELAKLGVSDAATATTRISGVSSSEGSGEVYVRGLGDRYLYTTLNGLPVPSDNIEKKNIDLGLFPTRVVSNVGISKTYSVATSADQASGNVNIESRELAGIEEFGLGARVGFNSNVMKDGVNDNFKTSPNSNDVTFGFYSKDMSTEQALTQQTWNPETSSLPLNYQYSVTAGKKIGESFKVFFTGAQKSKYEHRPGEFQLFQQNNIEDYFSDTERFLKETTTTGLLDLKYQISDEHHLKATSLFINKLNDEVFEAGRNGKGVVFEETPINDPENRTQFVRDQNTKQTRLWVNQLAGEHQLKNNEINWAVGYNLVNADEPNRIRNEVNFNDEVIELGNTGGYQQRKSSQEIEDKEFNARLSDELVFFEKEDTTRLAIKIGGNFRNKTRDFRSKFFGLEETSGTSLNPTSLDDLSSIFTQDNLDNGLLVINDLNPDLYTGELNSTAGFLLLNYNIEKWSFNVGARYQKDEINVDWEVNNFPGREGDTEKSYYNIYPSLNVKYSLTELMNIRLAASKTITLPEFKEIAPFEYVSPNGRITRGNPDLEASNVYNLDLKWEFFPERGELFSATGFYKKIEDPINRVQTRGASGVFSYFNSGAKAEVYGIELDAKYGIYEVETTDTKTGSELSFGLNVTRMWHEQDLKDDSSNGNGRTFTYNNKTSLGLEGASDWIFNTALNFSLNSENPLTATVSANYSSDKIFAIGTSTNENEPNTFFNNEIIEKGFVTLNTVISKDLGDHFTVQLRGRNLLNPDIERTQRIQPINGSATTETVRSYTKGAELSLGINYTF